MATSYKRKVKGNFHSLEKLKKITCGNTVAHLLGHEASSLHGPGLESNFDAIFHSVLLKCPLKVLNDV